MPTVPSPDAAVDAAVEPAAGPETTAQGAEMTTADQLGTGPDTPDLNAESAHPDTSSDQGN
jgi:hypothetical protein